MGADDTTAGGDREVPLATKMRFGRAAERSLQCGSARRRGSPQLPNLLFHRRHLIATELPVVVRVSSVKQWRRPVDEFMFADAAVTILIELSDERGEPFLGL